MTLSLTDAKSVWPCFWQFRRFLSRTRWLLPTRVPLHSAITNSDWFQSQSSGFANLPFRLILNGAFCALKRIIKARQSRWRSKSNSESRMPGQLGIRPIDQQSDLKLMSDDHWMCKPIMPASPFEPASEINAFCPSAPNLIGQPGPFIHTNVVRGNFSWILNMRDSFYRSNIHWKPVWWAVE